MNMSLLTDALPVSLIGMMAKLMCQYIEFVADRLLESLGYPKVYTPPIHLIHGADFPARQNKLFEKRVSEYKKASVGQKKEDNVFKMMRLLDLRNTNQYQYYQH